MKNQTKLYDLVFDIQYIQSDFFKLLNNDKEGLHLAIMRQVHNKIKLDSCHEKHKALTSSINIKANELLQNGEQSRILIKQETLDIKKSLQRYNKLITELNSIVAEQQTLINQETFFNTPIYIQLESISKNVENLTVEISKKVLLRKKEMLSRLRYTYVFFTLGATLLSILISILLSRTILTPLRGLSECILKMKATKFKPESIPKFNNATQEVQNIYNHFRTLSEELQQHETERNEALRSLKVEKTRHKEIEELIPLSIFETDCSGKIIYANRTMVNKFKASNATWRHKSYYEIFSLKHEEEHVRNNHNLENYEFTAKRMDNSEFPAMLYINQIKSKNNAHCYRGIIIDISKRKKYIEALKREKLRAEESDQLKTAFLANVSHELRTPLNGIVGFAELLSLGNYSTEEMDLYISQIKQSSDVLLNLINDILDFAKIETGTIPLSKSMFDLNLILEDIYKHFLNQLKNSNKAVKLNLIKNQNTPVLIETDRNRLIQILNNLIGNAIKFTPKGEINIGYHFEGNNIEIKVKDTGIGISEEKQKIIFDRFRQADGSINRSYNGTGLGLAISKNLIEILGGKIKVHSRLNLGSEFIISLPYQEPQASPTSINKASSQSKSLNNYDFSENTILIVEDDDSNYIYLQQVLQRTNASLIYAEDGLDAISKFHENKDEIDIILMDLNIPKLNGTEAIKVIRQTDSEIPIIAQTAYAFSNEKELAFNAGCSDFIAKPIVHSLLLDKINYHLIQNSKSNFIEDGIEGQF